MPNVLAFAKKVRANPKYPAECTEALKLGCIAREDAVICDDVASLTARIAYTFDLCLESQMNDALRKFLGAIRLDMRVQVRPYEAVAITCQFTQVPTQDALHVRVNNLDFICDSLFFNCNLTRYVEYLHFVQRCVDFPFSSVADAVAVFESAEDVVKAV
jgi:hypothetical protein